jgi:hypothetical protein
MEITCKASNGSFIVDEELFDYINQWKWRVSSSGYVQRSYYNPETKKTNECILLHRFVWEYCFGSIPDGLQINHIDFDPLNNAVSNLELVSSDANKRQKSGKNNKTGYCGVSYDPYGKSRNTRYIRKKPYVAKTRLNGKDKYLGRFTNPVDAHKAYLEFTNSLSSTFGLTVQS